MIGIDNLVDMVLTEATNGEISCIDYSRSGEFYEQCMREDVFCDEFVPGTRMHREFERQEKRRQRILDYRSNVRRRKRWAELARRKRS